MARRRTGTDMTRTEIILGGAALALYLLFRPGGEGAWAVVEIDGTEIARYALAADRTVTIGEGDEAWPGALQSTLRGWVGNSQTRFPPSPIPRRRGTELGTQRLLSSSRAQCRGSLLCSST